MVRWLLERYLLRYEDQLILTSFESGHGLRRKKFMDFLVSKSAELQGCD